MSQLVDVSQLTPTQLPVAWYLDPDILDLEKRFLFDAGPGYVGHEIMVPNIGDYYVPEWMSNAKMLVRNHAGIELLSNVCRHRQSLLLKGRGNTRNIVCPIHRWTYDLTGKLLGAPHFAENPCLNLGSARLQNWNGLLFGGKRNVARDLGQLGVLKDFDFSGHVLERVQVEKYACNWKTFIEVYLEDYHVEPYHPGLGNFVNTNELRWEFGEWYNVQTVGVKPWSCASWHIGLRQVARATLAPDLGSRAAAGRDMDALLSQRNAGMVSSRAGHQHAPSHRTRAVR